MTSRMPVIQVNLESCEEISPGKYVYKLKALANIQHVRLEGVIGMNGQGLTPEMYKEKTKQRFGRVTRDMGLLGELHKQKKEPHTEVLYVWAQPAKAYELDKKGNRIASPSLVLRSVSNLNNDELTEQIRKVGNLVETQGIDRADAEFVLDMLYADLQRRQEWATRNA